LYIPHTYAIRVTGVKMCRLSLCTLGSAYGVS
jgi:hypothetical protein